MSNFYSSQIDAIVADPALSNEEKIERLLVIESRARCACSQAREASNSLEAAGLPVLVVPVP